MPDSATSLGSLLAGLTPRQVKPRCPLCGGKLIVSVLLVADVEVDALVWAEPHLTARAQRTGRLRQTKRELVEQAESEAGRIDERDEIHCENHRLVPADDQASCTFWCHPDELAVMIERAARGEPYAPVGRVGDRYLP